jgi:hypothetical protein
VVIARNKITGDAAYNTGPTNDEGRSAIYTGNTKPGDNNNGNNRSVVIAENFIDLAFIKRGIYMKRGYEVARNYIKGSAHGVEALTIRHGGYSNTAGVVFSGLTDAVRGYLHGNYVDAGEVTINDTDHLLVSNRFDGNLSLRCGSLKTSGGPNEQQAASRAILVGNTLTTLTLGEFADSNHVLDPDQGGTLKGVKNYANGIVQPTPVRSQVEAGNAGYQEFTGNGGYTGETPVTRADLINITGWDATE